MKQVRFFKMCMSENRTNEIRRNQGPGVFQTWILKATQAVKIKFIQLDFSNLIFQNIKADQ